MHTLAAEQTEAEECDIKELFISTAVEVLEKTKLKYSISLSVLFCLYPLVISTCPKVWVFRSLKNVFNFIFLGYLITYVAIVLDHKSKKERREKYRKRKWKKILKVVIAERYHRQEQKLRLKKDVKENKWEEKYGDN